MKASDHNPTPGSMTKLLQVASQTAQPWPVIALALVLLLAGGCALDTEKLDRTREDLRALCADPVTAAGRSICDRYGLRSGDRERDPVVSP